MRVLVMTGVPVVFQQYTILSIRLTCFQSGLDTVVETVPLCWEPAWNARNRGEVCQSGRRSAGRGRQGMGIYDPNGFELEDSDWGSKRAPRHSPVVEPLRIRGQRAVTRHVYKDEPVLNRACPVFLSA